MADEQTVDPEFVALVDAVIAAGHTCQTILQRVNARIAKTPAGPGRDNLMDFRRQLIEKIKTG